MIECHVRVSSVLLCGRALSPVSFAADAQACDAQTSKDCIATADCSWQTTGAFESSGQGGMGCAGYTEAKPCHEGRNTSRAKCEATTDPQQWSITWINGAEIPSPADWPIARGEVMKRTPERACVEFDNANQSHRLILDLRGTGDDPATFKCELPLREREHERRPKTMMGFTQHAESTPRPGGRGSVSDQLSIGPGAIQAGSPPVYSAKACTSSASRRSPYRTNARVSCRRRMVCVRGSMSSR